MIKKIVSNRQAVIGLVLISVVIITAIFSPILAFNDPLKGRLEDRFLDASSQYPLGTDQLGRCIYSRLIFGSRYSIGISLPILLITIIISFVVGIVSGYYGGLIDRILVGVCDIAMAFPPIMIVLVLMGALGQGMVGLIISIIISIWVWNAKIIRSAVIVEKSENYIVAARIDGSSDLKIMVKHITPNIASQILVLMSLGMGDIIIMISSFSFLGLGVDSTLPEWGAMIGVAKKYIYSRPHLILYPGFCILFTVVGFNLLGEAIRDICDCGYGEYNE